MRIKNNNRAFTLVEILMSVALTVLLMSAVYGFYITARQVFTSGVSGEGLQDGANIILSKIIEGQTESGKVYRLGTSSTFNIPDANSGLIYFCQDNPAIPPCGPSDGSPLNPPARWYYLSADSRQLLYHHPTSSPTGYDVLYTAPVGCIISLRFSPALFTNGQTIPNTVEIDVSVLANLPSDTNTRVANIGTVSTYVLLRNH